MPKKTEAVATGANVASAKAFPVGFSGSLHYSGNVIIGQDDDGKDVVVEATREAPILLGALSVDLPDGRKAETQIDANLLGPRVLGRLSRAVMDRAFQTFWAGMEKTA